jgi:hypothetical protein
MNRLLRFLLLAVGPGEEDPNTPPPEPTGVDDSGSTGDEAFDDLLDLAEDGGGTPPPAGNEENAAVNEAKRRAESAERDLANERRMRQEAESRIPAPQPRGDPDFESEERELNTLAQQVNRGDATQEQYAWRKWQIDSNRNIRATQRNSQSALMSAQDLADKSAFDRLEITKPKVYKAYAERVEQAMMEMHRRGQNAPRLAVLRLLIGDDIMNGKVKKSTKAAASAQPAARVDRGRTPGVRSDVRGGRGAGESKRDQLAKKLDGVPI